MIERPPDRFVAASVLLSVSHINHDGFQVPLRDLKPLGSAALNGPSLRASLGESIGDGLSKRLLTPRQRQLLLSLATRVTVEPRGTICREHAPATEVFICKEGAAKAFRELRSGKRRVVAFLFADDLFGLAQNGRYLNTIQALTRMTYYRLPREPLKVILQSDADLQFQFLLKVVHELRVQQLHSIVMGRRSARGRIAMFLTMLEHHLRTPSSRHQTLILPMSRTDIADYLGLSLEAVSRAARQLVEDGILGFRGTPKVRILDRKRLEQLAADT
jgi:CRP-like cAMP-binding protein